MRKTAAWMVSVLGILASSRAYAATTAPASLNNCEKAVAKQAATFVTNKETALRTCLDAISKLVIGNQTSDASAAAKTCVAQFRKLNDSRGMGKSLPEKLNATIAKACDPTSNVSLTHSAGDVLGAPTTLTESLDVADNIAAWCTAFGGSGTMTAVADWTSCVSNAAECAVDTAIATQYPRALEWLGEIKPAMQALSAPATDPTQITDAVAGLDAVKAAIDGPDNDNLPSVACGQGGQLLTCQADLTACTGTATTCNAGSAAAADVLSGKTFSSSSGLGQIGAMPNRGAVTLTPGTSDQTIAAGYHNGSGKCAGDADLVSGSIKSGINLFGVNGSPSVVETNTATAAAADMLSGKTAYVNGSLVTGSVAAGSNVSGADSAKSFTIPNALYAGAKTATANDANLVAGNIKSGSSIFGVTGSVLQASGDAAAGDVLATKTFSNASGAGTGAMPNHGAVTLTPGTTDQAIAAGYHNGAGKCAGDASLVSGNIKSGATLFGVSGNPNVVNTNGATAAAGDLLSGKTAYANGGLVTGTVPAGSNVTGTNGSLSLTIPDALYAGSKTATANDTNLAAGNIKSGTSVFGVSGTVIQASGNAAAGDVLTTKTFSNASGAGAGTMANNGAVTLTPGTSNQTIAAGYHNGSGYCAGDANLVTGNIKSGTSIFGVSGSVVQASGNAGAGDVLSGKTFSNASGAGTGTMSNNGAVTLTPTTTNQTIAAGYHNGSGYCAGDTNLVTGNIKSGTTIFGVSGNLNVVNTSGATATTSNILSGQTCYANGSLVTGGAAAGSNVNGANASKTFTIPDGLYSGSKTATANDSNLVGGNIVTGVSIFGVAGTQPPSQALRTGQTTAYGTGSDGDLLKGDARQYTDNGNGTITDSKTGLMWEKKDQKSGGIHNWATTYTWGSTSSPYTMNGTMVTTFLAALNTTPCFAGYCDWRIPNLNELQSLANYQNVNPAVDGAFNATCAANCTVDGAASTTMCSCTQSNSYWSSTTNQGNPPYAWLVEFGGGRVGNDGKSITYYYVRAVRGGS